MSLLFPGVVDGQLVSVLNWGFLDTKIATLLNETGGLWTPLAPIIITGAGVYIGGSGVPASPTGFTFSGGASWLGAAGRTVTFGDSDYFTLATGHVLATHVVDESLNASALVHQNAAWQAPGTYFLQPASRISVPLRRHDGGQLSSVVITFKVGATHAAVPVQLPKSRLLQVAADGTATPVPLTTSDTQGYAVVPTPASGAAWYNGGAAQTLTLSVDTTKAIATEAAALYEYALEIVEETGANSFTAPNGNLYLFGAITVVNIADMRPQ